MSMNPKDYEDVNGVLAKPVVEMLVSEYPGDCGEANLFKLLTDVCESHEKMRENHAAQVAEAVKYCKPHIDQMWASIIVSILLGGEFRDADLTLKKYEEKNGL